MKEQYLLEYVYLKSIPAMVGTFQSHSNYEIFYFHEGQGHYIIGDKIHQLTPGMLIIMHGLTLHSPCSFDGFPYVRTLINFDQSFVRAIGEHLFDVNLLDPFEKLGNYSIILQTEKMKELELVLAEMNRHYSKLDDVSQARFRLMFLEVLCIILPLFKEPINQLPELPRSKERHIQEILSYIELNLMETIHLKDLEKKLYLNRHHIARLFRKMTGMTVFQYLKQRRLNEAKIRFLTEPNSSVTDVCYLSGFKNLSHFSRVFREQEGSSPEQFRRQTKI